MPGRKPNWLRCTDDARGSDVGQHGRIEAFAFDEHLDRRSGALVEREREIGAGNRGRTEALGRGAGLCRGALLRVSVTPSSFDSMAASRSSSRRSSSRSSLSVASRSASSRSFASSWSDETKYEVTVAVRKARNVTPRMITALPTTRPATVVGTDVAVTDRRQRDDRPPDGEAEVREVLLVDERHQEAGGRVQAGSSPPRGTGRSVDERPPAAPNDRSAGHAVRPLGGGSDHYGLAHREPAERLNAEPGQGGEDEDRPWLPERQASGPTRRRAGTARPRSRRRARAGRAWPASTAAAPTRRDAKVRRATRRG